MKVQLFHLFSLIHLVGIAVGMFSAVVSYAVGSSDAHTAIRLDDDHYCIIWKNTKLEKDPLQIEAYILSHFRRRTYIQNMFNIVFSIDTRNRHRVSDHENDEHRCVRWS